MENNEIWKDIKGYEGLYQVSNLGRIKSLSKMCGIRKKSEQIVKPFHNYSNYLIATLCKNGVQKHFQVHRLVALHFIPNFENKSQVDHINRDRSDNRVENLRWTTMRENCRNTSRNRNIKFNGESKTIVEWSEITGINPITIQARIFRYGWSVEEALNKKVRNRNAWSNSRKKI